MNTTAQLRGVNFGGRLVLEKWMTPGLFKGTDAVDEYTFMQTPGAAEKIDQHHKTFITEADFQWLATHGINAVRIPVGYWIFDGDDPYLPAIEYVDWAVEMAMKYNLRVLLDLHGAKGSQNGRDHSGRIGKSDWFKRADYREQTIATLERLAARYKDNDAIWGIELLNEPRFGVFHVTLRRFYRQAYRRLIDVARPGTTIVFSDAFTPLLMSGALTEHPDYPVVMDVHWYQFASVWQKWHRLHSYFARVQRRSGVLAWLQRTQPVIIGEWSVVLSEEILRNRTGSERQAAFKKHGQLQLAAYEHAAGWFYWTYKMEGRGIWNFRSQVEDGAIVIS